MSNLLITSVGLLPLMLCACIGSPKGTSVALFVAVFTGSFQLFKRLENTTWPIVGGRSRGINVRNLGLSVFTFLPLLMSMLAHSPRKPQLMVFVTCVAVAYFAFHLLEKLRRRIFGFVVTMLLVFSAINAAYFHVVGNSIGYQVFASILETNVSEATEFADSPSFRRFLLAFGVLLVVFLGFFCMTKNLVRGGRFVSSGFVNAAVMAVGISCPFTLARSKNFSIWDCYPTKEINQATRYFFEVSMKVRQYRESTYRFEGRIDEEKACTAILVIGESAQRDRHGIYSNGVETTPHLERLARQSPERVVAFSDATAISIFTRVSVPSLLSVSPAKNFDQLVERPSILRILKSAGLESVLISNQAKCGVDDNLTSAIMEDAVRSTYLQDVRGVFDKDSEDVEVGYDEAVVPMLLRELSDRSVKSKLIIVHLMGSHIDYKLRYPKGHAFFKPSNIENDYQNSIRYTDHVLKQIADAMMQVDRPAFMLYASDHGEYLNEMGDGIYGRGVRNGLTRFEIDVPFLFIFNERFQNARKLEVEGIRGHQSRPVSHDNISHTLLGLMGIVDQNYRPDYDLSADGFVVNPRYFVELSGGVRPLDKVHFDQR